MSLPNNVKRYDLTDVSRGMDCYSVMREAPDGDWVLYQEYENLQRECEAYLNRLKEAELRFREGW
jgi:hypothetical protein